ncbi:NrdH-redoxin [Candidatus Acetothermia bacterium]|jgi:glutaredoxin-like YruB-family protein|nr:glutaredoxin family protein [Candidatus Bipolaricaulota bacterium]RLE40191.1 MAG: NrdH-redoxin [Candidatus Acetothermia bacterium]
MSHEVIIYTTPTCSWCQALKEYLRAREVDFEEIDVSADPAAAQEMIDKSGQMGTPVVDIDGEIIVGFNKPEIDQLLGLN